MAKSNVVLILLIHTLLSMKADNFNLHSCNTLTIRLTPTNHHSHKIIPIEQLVRTINATNEVPYRSYIEINTILHTVYRGVQITPQDDTVFIFSRGYARSTIPGTNDNFIQRGACATAAHLQLRDHIVNNAPLISFDYDDSKDGFSFGQTNAIIILQAVYDAVLEKNPNARIVLIGDCRGAKVALELITQPQKNLKALILMTPFISARDLIDRIAGKYLSYLPLSHKILHRFFKFYFPNYNEKLDSLEKRLVNFPLDLPTFIAHRESDTLVGHHTIRKLEKILTTIGSKNVELLIVQDTTYSHSRLTENKEVQESINTFLKKYGLPYREIEK